MKSVNKKPRNNSIYNKSAKQDKNLSDNADILKANGGEVSVMASPLKTDGENAVNLSDNSGCENNKNNSEKNSSKNSIVTTIENIADFFAENKKFETLLCCLFMAVFIIGIFAIFLAYYGIFPFGKACMSSYDMLAQIAPFIEHFYDVIDGKSSLFYTYAIAGGADVFGTLAYCCLSPFTFIFLLFGRGNVYYGTAIVLPLKIVCIAISAFFYLKKRFNSIPAIISVGLSLCYAFCGYLFVSNTYINWVDLLIYLPWVALGFYNVVGGGSKKLFVLSLCLMVYTCFSITCFSFFLIFPIIILYCLICIKGKAKQDTVFQMVLSFVLVVAFCLPLLLPAFKAVMSSKRTTSLFENLFKEIKLNDYSQNLYEKITYLLTDSFTLFFTCAYFYKNGVKRPIDRFLLISGIIILVPVFVDESCNLLNFGSYMSYALRFGFLNGFYFLFVAALFISEYFENGGRLICREEKEIVAEEVFTENLCHADNKCRAESQKLKADTVKTEKVGGAGVNDKENRKTKKKRADYKYSVKNDFIFSAVLGLIVIVAFVSFGVLSYAVKHADREGEFIFGQWFSSRFVHSLGGLEVTAIIFAIVAIIALFGDFLLSNKRISAISLTIILMILLCGQTVTYSEHLVRGNKKTDIVHFDEMKNITDFVERRENNDNTRVKIWDDYITADMPFTLHSANMYSVFSSAIDSKNFTAPIALGYSGNKQNTIKTYNSKIIADCIMGYKYIIYDPYFTSEYDWHSKLDESKNYLEKIEVVDSDGKPVNTGNYLLYENKLAFPHAFMIENAKPETDKSDGDEWDEIMKMIGGSRMSENDKNKQSQIKKVHDMAVGQNIEFSLSPDKINVKIPAQSVENSKKSGQNYLFINYVCLSGHRCFINGKESEFVPNVLDFMVIPLENIDEKGDVEVEIIYKSPYIDIILFGIAAAMFIALLYYLLFIKFSKPKEVLCKTTYIAAIVLSCALIAFFLILPTCVFIYKSGKAGIKFVKSLLTKT